MTVRFIENQDQHKRIFSWFLDNVDSFDYEKDNFYLEFEDAKKRRSKLQNRYLWGWVYKQLAIALYDAGKSLGGKSFTPAILHAIAQANFRIISEGVDSTGKTFYVYRSTSDMGRKEFSEDIEMINRHFIEEYGVGIPDHRESLEYGNMAQELGL